MKDWLDIMLWLSLPYAASASIQFTPPWVAVPSVVVCSFLWLVISSRLTTND